MSMFSWYWPTSENDVKLSEQKMFKDLTHDYKIHQVPIFEGKEHINTITVLPTVKVHGSSEDEGVCADIATAIGTSRDSTADVVIAHGYGCGIGHYFKNYEPIARDTQRRVHGIDWLGMGNSSRPNMSKNPDDVETIESLYVQSLEEWRQAMNIDKMVLVGHSLGGYLSAAYALKYPQYIEKLVLASPVGIPERPAEVPERIKQLTGMRKLAYNVVRMGWDANITAQPHLSFHYSIKNETVFLYGSEDWMDKSAAEQVSLTMDVPTRVHVISQAGHNLFADNHIEFNRVLVEEILGTKSTTTAPVSERA
ncbi:hypothetical protein SARC_01594 [Sphaeroforma arctica JP610]|uniref:AB hydrolase-1 domain-containing protein n=1 Tax=Sphaeroforma arctica JP610 TaxID=667725 RepID=A0A0L0GB75_9EUKA|nr:hypothetical protein SARC_01594 [Sphaeroforma arctica JP610]KNC86272.1 hypothetical protein SARC_01594 [Sphaeroforma arctica JP610]|eukprot:XP_014160174.1 hypothetical protein SARC_01594 [Sphaeroforma arctica JP610]